MSNKDKRSGQREAKEKKRERMKPYREAEARADDVHFADQQHERGLKAKTDGTKEDKELLYRMKNSEKRWRTIDKNTNGRRCPGCERIVLNLRSWVIIFKDRLVLCRSCYYKKLSDSTQEEEIHLAISIFETENRYKIFPNELIQARMEAKLTQAKFASIAGWSRSYQAKLESGEYRTVSSGTKDTILEVLKRKNVFTEDL